MVAIINGARVTPPRPDIRIASQNPNAILTVVNAPVLITEEKKPGASPTKQIAVFTPEKLKKSSELVRLQQLIVKQRRGAANELIFKVKEKIATFKQQQLKNSRFAKEVGKGNIFDVLA